MLNKFLKNKWIFLYFLIGLALVFTLFFTWKLYFNKEQVLLEEKLLKDIDHLNQDIHQYTLTFYENNEKVGTLKGEEYDNVWVIDGNIYDSHLKLTNSQPIEKDNKDKLVKITIEDQTYEIPSQLLGITRFKQHLNLISNIIGYNGEWGYNDQKQVIIPLSIENIDHELKNFFGTSFNYSELPIQVSYVLWYDSFDQGPFLLSLIIKNQEMEQRLEYHF